VPMTLLEGLLVLILWTIALLFTEYFNNLE
jgi:hypothetical protein